MKTIDVQERIWRDRLYGNNYHSMRIILDYGTKEEKTLYGEFRYMTSLDQYATSILKIDCLYSYCLDNGIILRRYTEHTLLKNVKQWGKQ